MADVDRRALLALGGTAVAAAALPAGAQATASRRGVSIAGGVLLFDASIPEARALAAQARGRRLMAMSGDPVRLWRDHLTDHAGPVHGVTRWGDYLILRGLAEESRRRVRREERVAVDQGPSLVSWSMA